MAKNDAYTEIVKRFADPKGEFFRMFKNTMKKYRPSLTDDRIRDLFQDSFLAARKNLTEGRIKENTSWNSYLISIGLNLATHEFRSFGRFDSIDEAGSPYSSSDHGERKSGLSAAALSEEEAAVYNSPEVQTVFGETLAFMNEACRKILTLTLYDRLSSEEIAAELNSTPRSIITRRNRCKNKFIDLIKTSLSRLGYEV